MDSGGPSNKEETAEGSPSNKDESPVHGDVVHIGDVEATIHDDDDTDDWSRMGETDELHQVPGGSFRTESALEAQQSTVSSSNNANLHSLANHEEEGQSPVLRPSQPELTMKEKLVLRERERRIETERARLKRQFALNNNRAREDLIAEGDGMDGVVIGESESDNAAGMGGFGASGSVVTLGEESTMVHPDEDSSEHGLPVTMELFLRNSDSFNPQLEPTDEDNPSAHSADSNTGAGAGVLMERFLNDPVVAETVNPAPTNPESTTSSTQGHASSSLEHHRTVSFDVDQAVQNSSPDAQEPAIVGTTPVAGDASVEVNTSLQDQLEDEVDLLEGTVTSSEATPLALPTSSTVSAPDEPRVLMLTEADMQEMVATEEESIANYPPSDRDDNLSEVGELADFPIANPNAAGMLRGDVSQDTPTTVMDSASLISGGHGSEKPPSAVSSDRHSVDGTGSVHGTVTAQPPSERDILSPMMDISGRQQDMRISEEIKQPPLTESEETPGQDLTIAGEQQQPEIVNRRIRPGMVNLMPTTTTTGAGVTSNSVPAAALAPDAVVMEDFDFDKHDQKPPASGDNDSFQNLPDDEGFPPDMQLSPLLVTKKTVDRGNGGASVEYGAIEEGQVASRAAHQSEGAHESVPLLGDVPPEIITRRNKSNEKRGSSALISLRQSIRSRVNSIFSDVRSEELDEKEEVQNESLAYLNSSTFARAAPERLFALTITLLLEMPVLLMISGGADALCDLVGRRRFQLLLSFIPLTSAISGNVGLQASTLTTRAISHAHVTESDFWTWFWMEIGAAVYLGLGMGALLGLIAYIASQLDVGFALTIMIAQCSSIVTAGCTGTIAPLLFSFIFKRDSGKWGGPLETAVQDIVGSFAMVVLSYQLLRWFGTGPIDPNDQCGGGSSSNSTR